MAVPAAWHVRDLKGDMHSVLGDRMEPFTASPFPPWSHKRSQLLFVSFGCDSKAGIKWEMLGPLFERFQSSEFTT